MPGSLKYNTALSPAYGAGLRAGEVVALKTSDVDSSRMTLRIEQVKGRKDRYAILSPPMLARLRAWWRYARPKGLVVPRGRHRQAGLEAHAAALLCHAPAGAEGAHPRHPGAARPQEDRHHRRLGTRRARHRSDQAGVRVQQGALPGAGQERQLGVRDGGAGEPLHAPIHADESSPSAARERDGKRPLSPVVRLEHSVRPP